MDGKSHFLKLPTTGDVENVRTRLYQGQIVHFHSHSQSIQDFCLFVSLVGFLTSSSETRLYRRRAPRQSVWQFYVLPHTRQRGETMTPVSAGHIIPTPTQPVDSGQPHRESNPTPPHQESRALPTEQSIQEAQESLCCFFSTMPGGLTMSNLFSHQCFICNEWLDHHVHNFFFPCFQCCSLSLFSSAYPQATQAAMATPRDPSLSLGQPTPAVPSQLPKSRQWWTQWLHLSSALTGRWPSSWPARTRQCSYAGSSKRSGGQTGCMSTSCCSGGMPWQPLAVDATLSLGEPRVEARGQAVVALCRDL